jgi:Uncharacterized conserved protein (DUF2163)
MLPARNQPEFFFTLYLSNLFSSDLSKTIAICTNSNQSPLLPLRPLTEYIYTGDNEAVSISKTLAANPTNFKNIPNLVIPPGVVLSRQLIGTEFELTLTTFSSLVPTETTIMRGQVGKVTQKFLTVDLELLSDTSRLSTTSKLKTSVGCMNILGDGKCTVNKERVTTDCVGLDGTDKFLIFPDVSLNSVFNYEVIVGTTRYLVDKARSTATSIAIVGVLQGQPQKISIQKHCNKTTTVCTASYNNLAQFNGIVLLPTDGLVLNM